MEYVSIILQKLTDAMEEYLGNTALHGSWIDDECSVSTDGAEGGEGLFCLVDVVF